MTGRSPHLLRVDAQENRDRVVEAARVLFAEQGLAVTVREIARRAGVGAATLYRRFPTKQALVDQAFAAEMAECRAVVQEGCADPDPWRGLCSVVQRLGVLGARNQGFVDAVTSGGRGAGPVPAHRARLTGLLQGLTGRAQAVGALRGDVGVDDLVLVLLAVRGLPPMPAGRREAAALRMAALALDAFRATSSHGDLPPAPRLVPGPVRVVRRPVAGG